MSKIDKLVKLADKFEKKAQEIAQSGDIRYALQRARLWNISSLVAPLLENAGVPSHTSADINIIVNPGPDVSFNSNLSPNHPDAAQQLNNILKQRFGKLMNQALQSNNITSPITLNWLKVTKLSQR